MAVGDGNFDEAHGLDIGNICREINFKVVSFRPFRNISINGMNGNDFSVKNIILFSRDEGMIFIKGKMAHNIKKGYFIFDSSL